MLADVNTKSHPQARLVNLRKMWSIEKIDQDDQQEIPSDLSQGKKQKVKVKMMRVKTDQKGEDKLEEIGYKIGTRGNDCQEKLDKDLAKIEEDQRSLDEDYKKRFKG